MEGLFVKLEETLNSNRFTRAIMPNAEFILFGAVLLTILSIVPSITIWLAAVLCLAKRRFGALCIAFSVSTLYMLYLFIRSIRAVYLIKKVDIFGLGLNVVGRGYYLNIWTSLMSLLIFGGVTYLILSYYFKTEQGKVMKDKVFSRVNELKTTSPASTQTTENTTVTEHATTTETAPITESATTTETVSNASLENGAQTTPAESSATAQEAETSENAVPGTVLCTNCNHHNVSEAKFCRNCGEKLGEA